MCFYIKYLTAFLVNKSVTKTWKNSANLNFFSKFKLNLEWLSFFHFGRGKRFTKLAARRQQFLLFSFPSPPTHLHPHKVEELVVCLLMQQLLYIGDWVSTPSPWWRFKPLFLCLPGEVPSSHWIFCSHLSYLNGCFARAVCLPSECFNRQTKESSSLFDSVFK